MTDNLKALTHALTGWVATCAEPPPSLYPTLSAGELVEPNAKAAGFPAIPGAPTLDGKINPLVAYDFGSSFIRIDFRGSMSRLPPRMGPSLCSLVPRVDQDGNERVGVMSVQHMAPLGNYFGWNVEASGYYKGRGCGFQGGFIPFQTTRAEREAVSYWKNGTEITPNT